MFLDACHNVICLAAILESTSLELDYIAKEAVFFHKKNIANSP